MGASPVHELTVGGVFIESSSQHTRSSKRCPFSDLFSRAPQTGTLVLSLATGTTFAQGSSGGCARQDSTRRLERRFEWWCGC